MALIKCKECNKEISDKANACIHCGSPITKKKICKECGNIIKKDEKNVASVVILLKRKKLIKNQLLYVLVLLV